MSWKAGGLTAAVLALGVFFAGMMQDGETGTSSWDASRASGFAGYLLLWASTVTGLALYLRLRPARGPLTWMLEAHRITSVLALSFVAIHVLGLLLDPVVRFSLLDALVPFTSSYRPLQVGAGTIAQWLLIVVLASTALAGSTSWARWRQLHYLSFPCWALALLHGITSGSDTGSRPAMVLYIVTAGIGGALLAVRLLGRATSPMGGAPAARPARR